MSAKLTTVVKKGDAYHPLLMGFSFSRLLEKVHSYIDAYLQTCPSDHLIKVHETNSPHLVHFFEFWIRVVDPEVVLLWDFLRVFFHTQNIVLSCCARPCALSLSLMVL